MVIYPTDFSSCARNAIQFLVPVAMALKAEVKLVHGIGSPGVSIPEKTPLNIFEELESEKQKARTQLQDVIKALDEHNLKSSIEILQGVIPQALVEYIKEIDPELIVMGTVGDNALGNKLMGSLAYKLIKACHCPVLAIPLKTTYSQFQRIIYATNFSSEDAQNIHFLARLMNGPKNFIEIVHVSQSDSITAEVQKQMDILKDSLSQSVNQVGFKATVLTSGEVEKGLLNKIKENTPSALALSNTKRSFWESLFNKSLTNKMIKQADIPIIAFSSSE